MIEAQGTWERDTQGNECDAEWYYDPDSDTWLEEYPEPWIGLLDLQIDGVSPVWEGTTNGIDFTVHTYSESHVYRLIVTGTGDPLTFSIYDEGEENEGSLVVTIEPIGTVPTVSEWGLLTLAVFVLGAGVFVLRTRRRRLAAS